MIEHHADSKIAQLLVPWWCKAPRIRGAGWSLRSGSHLQCEAQVGHRPGQWANAGHVRHRIRWGRRPWRLQSGDGDDADARLQTVDAAEAGWNANRADHVRPELEERHPRRDGGRAATAGAAWGAARIPRIVRRAEQLVVCLSEVAKHERHVRLADDDGARLPRRRTTVASQSAA